MEIEFKIGYASADDKENVYSGSYTRDLFPGERIPREGDELKLGFDNICDTPFVVDRVCYEYDDELEPVKISVTAYTQEYYDRVGVYETK